MKYQDLHIVQVKSSNFAVYDGLRRVSAWTDKQQATKAMADMIAWNKQLKGETK